MDIESKINSLGLKVADHVTAMLAYWDEDLVCRFANAAYRDWFGKTREEMVGKMTIKELLGPLYEKNLPYILGALNGEAQTFEREIPTPAGGIRYSLANYFPDIENGHVKGFFVHVADISPIKLLEKELIKSNEIINNQNTRLMNFANIISHNLRNYAHRFSGLTDMLTEASPEKMQEIIGYLKLNSDNFTETLKHLNEIVSIQNLNGLELIEINLHDSIVYTLSSLNTQINASNSSIINKVGVTTTFLGNPAYIESVLVNFITNAIKYKHPDRSPIIELTCEVENNEVILTIADNGLGINLEKHGEDLFGMYKTFHGNTDATGIGLYITKYHIEAMGGKINVESEENKGSKFFIHFKQNPI